MKKHLIWLLALTFPFVILTSCARRPHRMHRDEESTVESSAEDSNQETSEEEDANNKGEADDEDEAEYDEWIGSGIYTAEIDANTIEIEMDDEKEEYILTDWAQEDLDEFETGDEISFYYFLDDDQLIIDEIRDADFSWEEEYGINHRHNHHRNNDHHRHHNRHRNRRDNRHRHHKRR